MDHFRTQTGRTFNPANVTVMASSTFNKGTAYTDAERDAMGLRGLMPACVDTLENQVARCYFQFKEQATPLMKFHYLNSLQEQNVTLFYALVTSHLEEMIPVVYTPVVGEACIKYSQQWRKPLGLFLSAKDKGNFRKILDNWKNPVDLIVVTDGSRILGLGDLGVNGMGIPVGKLSLYVAAALFHPDRVLPITIDVGCNVPAIRDDPLYLGLRQERLKDEEYYPLIKEFMAAVSDKWPECLVQFEDFQNPRCFKLLDEYFTKYLCFNDDIQGTGAVILAGFINAMKITGIPMKDHRILFFGAGSASTGVGSMIAFYLAEKLGIDVKETRKMIRMIDSKGLVVKSRTVPPLPDHLIPWACDAEACKDLVQIVRDFKPTALIGLSGQARQFSEEVIKEVHKHAKRPIIFALSNPTANAECTAEQAYTWTDGQAIFAAGSPFDPVEYKGKTYIPGQGNNMFIFPGLGFGAFISRSKFVTENMITRAAVILSECVSQEDINNGKIYPRVAEVQNITRKIAAEVFRTSIKDGMCQIHPTPKDSEIDGIIAKAQWKPVYPTF
eukprot:TRINITY_DN419_c0_g1_i1.p1 TRINITY_DN419_c0_g1~~TRINITY_DN419_c0_g1_i1.p1  ORF type:complete len:566 (+),score=93.20 TRINITY_DN419_c0_g1_i1:32-1699(+)